MKNLEFLGYKEYSVTEDGKVYSHKSKKFLKQNDRRGYCGVKLQSGKYIKDMAVHRIVALAFIGRTDDSLIVNHKDGNKKNNSVENLEWVTYRENYRHAVKRGLSDKGLVLSDADVHTICRLINADWTMSDISRLFCVKRNVVHDIRYGRNYTHISSQYKFPKKRSKAYVSESQKREILNLLKEGNLSHSKIGEIVRVGRHVVTRLNNLKT